MRQRGREKTNLNIVMTEKRWWSPELSQSIGRRYDYDLSYNWHINTAVCKMNNR